MYYLFCVFNGYGYNFIDISDSLVYLIKKRKALKRKNPTYQYCILRDIYWRIK